MTLLYTICHKINIYNITNIIIHMQQDKHQEDFVNPATDKRTEKATKREPNPKPMKKIFEMSDKKEPKKKKKAKKY